MRTLENVGRLCIWPLVLLAAICGNALASSVELEPIPALEVDAGAFATWGYRVENTSRDALTVTVTLDPPPGWSLVSTDRSLRLRPGEIAIVPFTVWIPPQATADLPHEAIVRVSSRTGEVLASVSREILVPSGHGVEMQRISRPGTGKPGESVHYTFRIENLGNATDTYALAAMSIPDWHVDVSPPYVALRPGETRDMSATVHIPHSATDWARHLLTLTATLEPEARLLRPAASATAQAITTVRIPLTKRNRYRGMPGSVILTAGGPDEKDVTYGVRVTADGDMSPTTRARFELDVISANELKDEKGLWDRYAYLAVTGETWEVSVGDVLRKFPDIATRTLSGRGASFRYTGDRWGARGLAAYGRRSGEHTTFAGGAERRLAHGLWLGADVMRRNFDETDTTPEKTVNMGIVTTRYEPQDDLSLTLEGAYSLSEVGDDEPEGKSAQFIGNYRGTKLRLKTRVYAGTEEFEGWYHDRDGFVAYARVAPVPPLALWVSGDASQGRSSPDDYDSPWLVTGWYRGGLQISTPGWPRLELSAGGELDKEGKNARIRKTEKRDVGASMWHSMGPLTVAASGRMGNAYNHLEDTEGETAEYGASIGARVGGVRLAARWTRSRDWEPVAEQKQYSTAIDGDLSWISRGGGLSLGVGVSNQYYDYRLADQEMIEDSQVRPRISIRLTPHLRLRSDSSLRGIDRDLELERWQAQLTWAATDLVPMVWSPIRGGIEGTVFIDANQNGQPDAGEKRVSGVIVLADGEQQVCGRNGVFEFPAIDPGSYWIDINWSSLPTGLVPSESLPIPIHVDVGEDTPVRIALVESGEISGQVFHDTNYDGALDPTEAAARDIRMILLRAGIRVDDCLTDHTGAYSFRELAPGDYLVKPTEDWLPPGWINTGVRETRVSVGPGDSIHLDPYGVAEKERPVIKTFTKGRVLE